MNSWHLLLFVLICVIATAKQEETRGSIITSDKNHENKILNDMEKILETQTLNINEIDAFQEFVSQIPTLQATIPNEVKTNHDLVEDRIMMLEKESIEPEKSIIQELRTLYDIEVQKTLPEVREYIKSTVFPALKENIRAKSVKLCESKYVSDDWYLKTLSEELQKHKINIVSEFSGKMSELRCLRFFWN